MPSLTLNPSRASVTDRSEKRRLLLSALMLCALCLVGCNAEGSEGAAADAVNDSVGGEMDTTSGAADGSIGTDATGIADGAGIADTTDIADGSGVNLTAPLGGDRPAKVSIPADYDPSRAWPIIILLHGYTASGTLQDYYFNFSAQRTDLGFIAVMPDGTIDQDGKRFWNASSACCDLYGTGIDDVGYLWGLIEEARERYNIDPSQIHIIGHSNGGFMAYRLACEHGDEIASIASLAGAALTEPARCTNPGKVSVLQIHGTNDETIAYEGGVGAWTFPGAEATVARWAERNGCEAESTPGAPLDVDGGIPGDETLTEAWSVCDAGTAVELWTIPNGSHLPNLSAGFIQNALGFLLDHPKVPTP